MADTFYNSKPALLKEQQMSNCVKESVTDVAEVMQCVKQLEGRLKQLRQIVDLVPDFIFANDWQGRYLIANKALAQALGTTVDKLEGSIKGEICPSIEQSQRMLTGDREVMEKNCPIFILEESVVDYLGNHHIVQIRRIPYVDNETGSRAVLGVGTDITERKLMEVALQEKVRLEHELDIARSIQLGLLPAQKPVIERFDIGGWNQAAEKTGGDYYDWFTFKDGRTVVSIADATGHGIGPALIVPLCRAYFRALLMNGSSLEKAICHVNDLLSHDLPPDRFVTAAVGVLEPAKYSMQFFSAGHGPIFFYDASKRTVYKWPANDHPLGIREGKITGKPSEILFSPGDILVLITDGFFEWRNPGEEPFGENRIAQAIQRLSHLDSDALIDGLYREVIDFSNGTKQADDLTALVIKRTE